MTNKFSFGLLLGVALLAGCVSERVVLLPSSDGQPSGVIVRDQEAKSYSLSPMQLPFAVPGSSAVINLPLKR